MHRGTAGALIVALALCGCRAVERSGEDVKVVATYPLHVVSTPTERMRRQYRKDPALTVAFSPFLVPLYILEDTFLTGVSAADAALFPVYAPFEVRPLGLYQFRGVQPHLDRKNVRKFEERAAWFAVVFVWLYGYGRSGSPLPGDPPGYHDPAPDQEP